MTRPQFPSDSTLDWTLRVGACACFVGHGAFGVMTKAAWVPYFGVVGIGHDSAYALMPIIGTLDIILGCFVLISPRPAVLYWMLAWAIWTALLRPLSGEPFWEALERAGNYGVPLALLYCQRPRRSRSELFLGASIRTFADREWRRLRHILVATTALLLVGHGMLGIFHKAGLIRNLASVIPNEAEQLAPMLGWLELGLAVFVIARPAAPLLVFIAIWKLATELLFVRAGANAWEVVERGGSYAAPLALAIAVTISRSLREREEHVSV